MDTSTTWLTTDAYHKLQEEYDTLTTDGRLRIADRLAEARAHGDIRENADYDAAKTEQGLMEARIRKLRHLLDNAVVGDAESGEDDDGTVRIGSVVTLRDEYGDEDEYFVAIPENKVRGYLLASPAGPLGTALIGASVGDDVSYEAPGGTFSVKVIAVRPYGA
ncbi:MAG: transcription elongation factor GreA [bacterium]|nr:transcription elongation factor GreA [bacterium]MDE0289650.1 transcription elongation factor GreA [bacterium]MDE0437924.1 transcription elongation factor GreA [bacterium]